MIESAPLRHNITYDGVTLHVYHADKGEGIPSHKHLYTHLTICHNGSCKVSLEGRSYVINKNTGGLNLPSNEWHEIEALEDNTVFVNVFAEGKY